MNVEFIDILTSFLTSLIMFGVGLALQLRDLKEIFKRPQSIIIALTFQMIALPVIAYFICLIAPLKPEFKLGLIILACSPGGTTSGFLSYLLKANVALSVALTAINSLLCLISIPIIVSFGLKSFMSLSTKVDLPIISTITQIFFIIIIPTFIGIALRQYKKVFAIRIEKIVKIVMVVLLLGLFIIKFFAGEKYGGSIITKNEYALIFPYAILFNVICLLMGYFFIKLFKFDHKTGLTTSIETSVHNTPLALLIAGTILGNQEMVKPILIYTIFSFWTPIMFGLVTNRLVNRAPQNKSR